MFDETKLNYAAFDYYAPLARVNAFVAAHYAEPLPLARAARIAGFEKTYFSHFFHEKTGVRYRDWLGWIRVQHALEMLGSRDFSITEVAFAVGFQDLRTFERAFERCTGASPREMRNRVRSALLRGAPARIGSAGSDPNK